LWDHSARIQSVSHQTAGHRSGLSVMPVSGVPKYRRSATVGRFHICCCRRDIVSGYRRRAVPLLPVGPDVCRSAGHGLNLGEDGQYRGHRTPAWRGQVERLGQRDETYTEVVQFLESGKQICHRSAPAVQPPHQHETDPAEAPRFQQLLPQLPFGCAVGPFGPGRIHCIMRARGSGIHSEGFCFNS